MLVAGASRHAKEILDLLYGLNQVDDLCFFDDVTVNGPDFFYERFPIVHGVAELSVIFKKDNRVVLGLGGPKARAKVAKKLVAAGGKLHTVVAASARIGQFQVSIGAGVNMMEFVLVSSSVAIGEGSLINAYAAIHHDVTVGAYSEISPRATLLGGASVGDFCSVGSGAIILPNIKVGNNVVIGAGSVVRHNVADNSVVVGVPGRVIKNLDLP